MLECVGEPKETLSQPAVKEPDLPGKAQINEVDNIQDPMSFSSIAEQTELKERKNKARNLKTPIVVLKGK